MVCRIKTGRTDVDDKLRERRPKSALSEIVKKKSKFGFGRSSINRDRFNEVIGI